MKPLFIFAAGLLLLSACSRNTDPERLINSAASLPESFRLSGQHQKVMTSLINNKTRTMSILYGNEPAAIALQAANLDAPDIAFTLLTWRQQEDAHWFGARIPGELISAETLQTGKSNNIVTYRKFTGKNLIALKDTVGQAERIRFILSQKPSIIP